MDALEGLIKHYEMIIRKHYRKGAHSFPYLALASTAIKHRSGTKRAKRG